MKKCFSIIIAMVLTMAILVACANRSILLTPSNTTTPETTTPPATTLPPDTTVPPTTEAPVPTPPKPEFNAGLTDWIIDEELRDYTGAVRVASPLKLTQGMQEIIDEFKTYYPNITIEWSTYPNNKDGNMRVDDILIENGDVDVIHSTGLHYVYTRWANGLLLDITDKLMDEGIDMITNWGTDDYHYNGRYYSIPFGGVQKYIAINKTAWDAAGLGEIPTEWTWDEYLEACRKMTKTNEDGSVFYGGSTPGNDSRNTMLYCLAQVTGGDPYFSTDGTKSNYAESVAINAFERQLNATLEEKIWRPVRMYSGRQDVEYDWFLRGEAATIIGNILTRYIHDSAYEETRDFITAFAPFPVEEKGQTNYMSGVQYYSHLGIAKNCKDDTAAWLFVKFMSSYGSKYLASAGHHSTWRGTTMDDIVAVLYESEEDAAKYVDVESFKHVIGRTGLPSYKEIISDSAMVVYKEVTSALSDPYYKASIEELTAEEALKQAAQEADAYISNMMG